MAFDFLEDAWDFIVDSLSDFFSFEWLGDAWDGLGDFFSNIGDVFSNLGELSGIGFAFGLLGVGLILLPIPVLKHSMLSPFMQNYEMSGKIIWGGITILGTFIAGYVIGSIFENS
jgi:hypothetical protein